VHLRDTWDAAQGHLLTHVKTTPAHIAAAKGAEALQQALVANGRAPNTPLADAGDLAADRFVQRETPQGITRVGPVRDRARWQPNGEGAYALEQYTSDWAAHSARCPAGHRSASWSPFPHATGHHAISVTSAQEDCAGCPQRTRCTRAKGPPRSRQLQRQPQQEAIDRMRADLASEAGHQLYAKRAGIEGTGSHGVRVFGLRRRRSIGLATTHGQQVASAAALHLDRLAPWCIHRPRAHTRVSRFAALAG
jgi:transposase